MRRALLFNPENDLALAADTPRYTPPPAAVALARAGALLPLWWCQSADIVIAPEEDSEGAARLRREFGVAGDIAMAGDFATVTECAPWGWSRDAHRRFCQAGVDASALPPAGWLDRHRQLSHRRVSVSLLEELGTPKQLLPVEAFSLKDALDAVRKFDGEAFIKLPWSSSGRGVFDARRLSAPTLTRYIEGFIRRQGSVMVERARHKIADFAMLFYCAHDQAVFKGLSGFHTDPAGHYLGNIIASDETIVRHLGVDPREWAAPLSHAISVVIAPGYDGWVGVDMMTEMTSSGHIGMVPCVEANVRMTMGVVARFVYDRLGRDMVLSVVTRKPDDDGAIDLSPVSADTGMHIIAAPRP